MQQQVLLRDVSPGRYRLVVRDWLGSIGFLGVLCERDVEIGPGPNELTIALGAGCITVAYSMLGGLRGVLWTDLVQFCLAWTGAILAAVTLAFAPVSAMAEGCRFRALNIVEYLRSILTSDLELSRVRRVLRSLLPGSLPFVVIAVAGTDISL